MSEVNSIPVTLAPTKKRPRPSVWVRSAKIGPAEIDVRTGTPPTTENVAPLEVAPPPDSEDAATGKGRATLAAGAALSFATAPFAQPLVEGAARWLAPEPPPEASARRRALSEAPCN